MTCYKNTTPGARAVLLKDGLRILVESGDTILVDASRIVGLPPGLVEVTPEAEESAEPVPPVPADIAAEVAKFDHDGDGKVGGSKKGAVRKRRKSKAKRKPKATK